MANIFVGIDDDVALAGLDGEGNDFVLEAAGLLGCFRLVLRGNGKLVLLVARKLPLPRDIFRGDAHVIAVEGVRQAVLDHGVDHLHVAHLGAGAKVRSMRRHRHGFLAAGDDDLRITRGDLLQAECDGAQAGTAKLVHAPCGRFLRNTGLHRSLTGGILPLTGLKHLAEDHFIDFLGIDAGTLQHTLDRGSAELMRRNGRESAVERTDRSAGSAGDNDG